MYKCTQTSSRAWRFSALAFLVFGLLVFLPGCSDSNDNSPVQPQEDLRTRFNLQTLGEIPYPPDNLPRQERISLGRLIFFDPILGGEKNVACGTCHHPDFGFADRRQFGAGTSGSGLGPNRIVSRSDITGEAIQLEPRHTPSIWNTAFNADESGVPSAVGFQFLDGRTRGLEQQAKKPIGSRVEMKGDAYSAAAALDSVIVRLRAIPEYVKRFQDAFPEDVASKPGAAIIDTLNYGRAIAAYERE
ncbi:MAG: cytochrome-c peroxidase, partial [bacterium]